jgi:hypothetical protein
MLYLTQLVRVHDGEERPLRPSRTSRYEGRGQSHPVLRARDAAALRREQRGRPAWLSSPNSSFGLEQVAKPLQVERPATVIADGVALRFPPPP